MNELRSTKNDLIGRSPTERLLLCLERNKLIESTITFLILFILVGTNSKIHDEYDYGFVFFIIILLVLLTGKDMAINFFGSSALALFIALHISLFGFNALPLVFSFIIYILIRDKLEKNLLWPISVYLTLDSIFSYFKIQEHIGGFISVIGQKLFSKDALFIAAFIPVAYAYLHIDRRVQRLFRNDFWMQNGTVIILGVIINICFILSFLIYKPFYILMGVFLMLYIVGLFNIKDDIKIICITMIPLIVIAFLFKFILV